MPKPTKPLTYSARDDSPPSPGATHASPPGSPTKSTKPKVTLKKRKLPVKAAAATAAHESKKPKLFTLRASRSEYSDDEEAEAQWEEEEQPECSSARESSVFVPASLRSPNLLMATVEESVEEVGVRNPMKVFLFVAIHSFLLLVFSFSLFSLLLLLCMASHSMIQTLHSHFPPPPDK